MTIIIQLSFEAISRAKTAEEKMAKEAPGDDLFGPRLEETPHVES